MRQHLPLGWKSDHVHLLEGGRLLEREKQAKNFYPFSGNVIRIEFGVVKYFGIQSVA
uniref:Uncharacterized protein n=1 Tax=Meloidogyne incognita TaxID=6306 RepID=A0A914N2L0_MELIC